MRERETFHTTTIDIACLDPRSLKRDCDFFALVSQYTRLHRAGRQWRGLCPFHRESNPSLYIEPQQKIWKCFGCERGGDVFDFVMLAEDCDFPRALQIVAGFIGVARESAPRSGARFRACVGAKGPYARAAGGTHSPKERDSILARLDATEKRNAAIRMANDSAFAEFERDCEPRNGSLNLVIERITGHE